MARLDANGKPIPIDKPTSTKKKKSSFGTSKKTSAPVRERELGELPKAHNNILTEEQQEQIRKASERKQQNNINRNFGKSVERKVADLTGGTRVPMSGAVKNSVHNLEGDVSVRSRDGKRTLFLIECKGQSPKENAKSFTIKIPVLKQAESEATLQKAIPVVWYHIKGEDYDNDWVFIPAPAFLRMVEGQKDVHDIEYAREG